MEFVLICRDKPGHLDTRLATREAHLAWVATKGDAIRLAGPLLDDDGSTMIGSLFIVEVDDRQAAEALNAGDPYTLAGLFADVTVHPFRQVIPAR